MQEGQVLDINLAYGYVCLVSPALNNILFCSLGCAFGVYVAGEISGGHLNPAVSISQAILGNISLKKCAVYIAGQFAGAFLGRDLTKRTIENGICL